MLTKPNQTKGLSIFLLVMLISGAIDSIRNLPATALFGSTLMFFLILAAIFFLIPTALISAQLSANSKSEGGIYGWVHEAFGKRLAFLAIWLQWINTMVWYPTMLSFIAGTIAYLINPQLADNKAYLVSIILITFWVLTLVNLKGVKASAKFATFCAIIGMVIPMVLIIAMALVWVLHGDALQIQFHANNIIPSFTRPESWVSLTAIMASFLGIELATVHVKNVENPQKAFPKAMMISVIIILATMLFGALAIAIVVPRGNIHLVNGVMQAFVEFLSAYHLTWMTSVLTVMIVAGSIGSMVNWIISPAKGLLQAGKTGYLPAFLTQENSHGVASRLLFLQAVLVTLVCLAFILMPSINGSYWLLTDLSTQLYVLMYVIMFFAAIVLVRKHPKQAGAFCIPFGKLGTYAVSGLGLIGCVIALFVGFIPPEGIGLGSHLHYELMFGSGIILMIVPIVFFYGYQFLKLKQNIQNTHVST